MKALKGDLVSMTICMQRDEGEALLEQVRPLKARGGTLRRPPPASLAPLAPGLPIPRATFVF